MSIEHNVTVFQAIACAKCVNIQSSSLWSQLCDRLIDQGIPHRIDVEDALTLETILLETQWMEVVSPNKRWRRFLTKSLGGWQGVLPLDRFDQDTQFEIQPINNHQVLVANSNTPRYVDYLTLELKVFPDNVCLETLQPGLPCGCYQQPIQENDESVLLHPLTHQDARSLGFKAAQCKQAH